MNFLLKVLTDSDGNPSSKRLTGFIALLMWVFLIIYITFTSKELNQDIWYAVNAVIGWVVGMTTIESKSNKNKTI